MATRTKKAATTPPPGEIPVSIENVGGIQRADLVLKVGVNELTGANGAGKTSAANAIRRAFGENVKLEKRDGAAEGRIEAPGVTVKIRSQVRPTGEAVLDIVDSGPVTRVIDPGRKGSDEAASDRVRGLVELVDPEFDAATLRELAADQAVADEVLAEYGENSFHTLYEGAERIRLVAHKHARAAEDEARAASARATVAETAAADALAKVGGPEAMVETPVAEAEAIERAAAESLGRAKAARETRVALEASQASARAEVGETPDPARFDGDIELRRNAIAAADRRLAELEAEKSKVREAMNGTKHDLEALLSAQADETRRLDRHRRLVAVLEQPVVGPTEDEVDALAFEVTRAAELRRSATASAEVRNLAERAETAKLARDAAHDRAVELRERAQTVYDRLAELPCVADRAGRLTVVAGRLHVRDENGNLHDFETRRSEGQRIDAVLEVAAQVYGAGSIIALDDRYWLALDDERRLEFAALAKRHGLYVVTCRPTVGPLAVQNLAPEAQPALAEVSA